MASMKSVLITGCSAGGIGEALARSFQKRGYLVFATARNTSKIPAGLLSLPNVEKIALDVTSLESIAAAVEIVSKRTNGTLDVLVNNSGSGLTAPGLDTDLEKAKAMYDVNFWGVLSMVQKFSPLLVKAKGTIVNLSSVVGEMHAGYFSIYGSSKAALTQASETWRLELAPLGVRVITVITGIIESNFFNNTPEYHTPEGSFYKSVEKNIQDVEKTIPKATPANEFADSVVSAVAAGTSGKLFTGSLSVPMKYLTTYAPNFVLDKVFSDKRGFETLAKEVRV